jgi:glucokinase
VTQERVVGIDVGGTRIKAVLTTRDGAVLADRVRPTPPDVGERLGAVAADLVAELAAGSSVAPLAVGVVVPGLVEEATARGILSVNLGWRDFDLGRAVRAHVDLPVAVGHDVRAGLLAEHRWGAARDCDNVLFLPLGTGLASALLVRGRVLTGSPWSGEIGHVIVVPDGPECGCGQRGCLEAVASAGAIGRRWSAATGQAGDAEQVAERARAGEPEAVRIWTEAVDALTSVIAPVVAAVGIELVVVGGGLAHAGATLFDPLRAALAERLGARDDVRSEPAALGDRAGALGAAALALDVVWR